jgi:hypothetical protein
VDHAVLLNNSILVSLDWWLCHSPAMDLPDEVQVVGLCVHMHLLARVRIAMQRLV